MVKLDKRTQEIWSPSPVSIHRRKPNKSSESQLFTSAFFLQNSLEVEVKRQNPLRLRWRKTISPDKRRGVTIRKKSSILLRCPGKSLLETAWCSVDLIRLASRRKEKLNSLSFDLCNS